MVSCRVHVQAKNESTYLGHTRLTESCRLLLTSRGRGSGAMVHLTLLLDPWSGEGRLVELLAFGADHGCDEKICFDS